MKKVFTLILALALGFGLKAQCPLTTAVDFTATDCHGQQIHLFDILDGGQAVVIDFFYTTCGPCQQATPKIAESYTIMGCNLHDVYYMEITPYDADAACQNWVNNYGIEYPTIGTTGGGAAIVSQYQIGAFPTVILVMPDHSIAINDLWPISNAQTIVTQLGQHGLEPHDCNTVVTYDPQVALDIDDVTENSITATFTPNGDCASYYYLCATETELLGWVALLGEDLVAIMQEYGNYETAPLTTTFNDLLPETEYYVVALPVDPDGNYGEPENETVTTLPQVIIYDPQVTIDIDDVTENTITATFTPNADCTSYYYLCATEAEIIGWITMGANFDQIVQEHGGIETATLTHTFTDLIPDTEYKVAALPVDPDGNYGNVVQQTVTTLPIAIIYDETLTFSTDTVNIVDNQYDINWVTVYNNTAEDALITGVCDQYEMLAFTWDGYNEFLCYEQIEITIPQGESVELGFICNIISKNNILTDVVTLSSNLPDASFVVMLEQPWSVEENAVSISLFPNPANESVTLKGESLGIVRVFNVLGQKMDEFEANGSEVRINTTSYENGIYVVKANEQTLRFVVKH